MGLLVVWKSLLWKALENTKILDLFSPSPLQAPTRLIFLLGAKKRGKKGKKNPPESSHISENKAKKYSFICQSQIPLILWGKSRGDNVGGGKPGAPEGHPRLEAQRKICQNPLEEGNPECPHPTHSSLKTALFASLTFLFKFS